MKALHAFVSDLVALVLIFSVTLSFSGATEYTIDDILESRCKPNEDCYPSSAQIDQLDQDMDGDVLRNTDADYYSVNLMYNVNQQRSTHLIARVKTASDIQKAVVFARDYNLHVTIKSTGHDYCGRSTWEDSFVIHLGWMKEIEVNPNRTERSEHGELKTQTGTDWKTIYLKLDEYDRTIVGGSAHTVGPGGYTLGGGHSPISRSLGYAVDNVLEMQVVLADGSIATCTESQTVIEHPNGTIETRDDGDLLWALRGGGGGTFGVTVYIIFKLHPQPKQMVSFSGTFPLIYEYPAIDAFDEVMTALRKFILNSPTHWGGYWIVSNSPWTFMQYQFRGSVFLFLNKFGPWNGNEYNELSDFFTMRDKYTLLDIDLKNRSSFWDYERNANDPASSDAYLMTSLLSRQMAAAHFNGFFRTEMLGNMKDMPVACTGILVGGKTTEPSITSSPLHPGYRSAVSIMSCGVNLFNSRTNRESYLERAKSFAYRIRTMGEGMYFNEPSIDSVYWRQDFWGQTNYDRLLTIKHEYDPDNLFTCYHCVGSDNSTVVPPSSGAEPATKGSMFGSLCSGFVVFTLSLIMHIY